MRDKRFTDFKESENGTEEGMSELKVLLERAILEEREECAKICERDLSMVAWQCAEAIRARQRNVRLLKDSDENAHA